MFPPLYNTSVYYQFKMAGVCNYRILFSFFVENSVDIYSKRHASIDNIIQI
jgi:hypothetical protein